MTRSSMLILICFLIYPLAGTGQDSAAHSSADTLIFSGQLSSWLTFSHASVLPLWAGARYIPQLNYEVSYDDVRKIDFEVSANIHGSTGMHPFDSIYGDGNVRPYRAWARYSTPQFELRAGLQTINFGSASILRPLMWFEVVDPRDPLRITTGVWGLLARYYFLNNANLWLWGLYGNDEAKTWEIGKTSQRSPEFGGRFQTPIPAGEAGVSFHHRLADTRGLQEAVAGSANVSENRVALDAKWDVGPGLWFEGSWINKREDSGMLTNQLMVNMGADYTFGVGNGLNIVFEELMIAYDRTAFALAEPVFFSALSAGYPVGLFDHLSAMIYYNWSAGQAYNLLNWRRQFNRFYVYLLAYWNPDVYNLPQRQDEGNLFAGRGVQLMLVFNH